MKYKLEIREILSKIIEIEANSQEEALEKARHLYEQEKIVLDYSDFVDYDIQFDVDLNDVPTQTK